MTLYKWSQTAAADATADTSINWQEGQAPSSVNDSARAMMAATAKYRDDIAGAIVTSGTSTAYAVNSYQVFDTLAHLSGQMIAFTPHTTNTGACTLNPDGLGAKPLRSAPNVELLSGVLLQGTPYTCVYNNSDQAFYLRGFYGNPYNVPLAAGLDYWGSSAPNSSFAFPIGQAINRTTYATLFAIVGTAYGSGDGSTTFNLPDKTGRVSAMKEAAASRLSPTYFGGNSASLGATGGLEYEILTLAQLPAGITSQGSNSVSVTTSRTDIATGTIISSSVTGGAARMLGSDGANPGAITSTGTNSISVTSNNTSGNGHANVQPTIVCNYIIRVL